MFYIADLAIKIWLTFTAIAELNFALSCRFVIVTVTRIKMLAWAMKLEIRKFF